MMMSSDTSPPESMTFLASSPSGVPALTAALLDTRQAELRKELDADSLEAEIICCLGAPPAHLPGSGAVWDGAA